MALGQDAAARFRTTYEVQAGALDDMEWFEALMALKRLFSVLVSLRVGPETMGMRRATEWCTTCPHWRCRGVE